MIDPQTLVGLACLIANQGPTQTTADLEAQLTDQQKSQIQDVISSGACLPDKVEELIRSTQQKIDEGKLKELTEMASQPCDCSERD